MVDIIKIQDIGRIYLAVDRPPFPERSVSDQVRILEKESKAPAHDSLFPRTRILMHDSGSPRARKLTDDFCSRARFSFIQFPLFFHARKKLDLSHKIFVHFFFCDSDILGLDKRQGSGTFWPLSM
jgi:hypothetical protein